MTDDLIREIFVANGFKLNGEDTNGKPDLRPYVYQAARALLSRAKDAQAVRTQEPVAYLVKNHSWGIKGELKFPEDMPVPAFDGDKYDVEIPLYAAAP